MQLIEQVEITLLVNAAFFDGNLKRNHGQHYELTSECFGAGHAYLGSGMRIGAGVRYPGDRGSNNIHNAKNNGTLFFRLLDGHNRISGLPALGYGYDNIPCVYNRVTVAE